MLPTVRYAFDRGCRPTSASPEGGGEKALSGLFGTTASEALGRGRKAFGNYFAVSIR